MCTNTNKLPEITLLLEMFSNSNRKHLTCICHTKHPRQTGRCQISTKPDTACPAKNCNKLKHFGLIHKHASHVNQVNRLSAVRSGFNIHTRRLVFNIYYKRINSTLLQIPKNNKVRRSDTFALSLIDRGFYFTNTSALWIIINLSQQEHDFCDRIKLPIEQSNTWCCLVKWLAL